MRGESGHLIAVTGVPSSGKSTVSRALESRSATFSYFDGDQFIRDHPPPLPLTAAGIAQTFASTLDALAERMASANVILDVTLPAAYVKRTKERFGASVMLVSLRVDEDEWRRRENQRPDRPPLEGWGTETSALQGPEELYDLAIDTTHKVTEAIVEEVLSEAQQFWDDLSV